MKKKCSHRKKDLFTHVELHYELQIIISFMYYLNGWENSTNPLPNRIITTLAGQIDIKNRKGIKFKSFVDM